MAPEIQLGIVILAVHDLPRSVSFYRAAFGWQQTVGESAYAEFNISAQQRLGLYQREGFGRCTGKLPMLIPEGELAATELYFFAQDVSVAIARLEQAGARRLSPLQKRDWGDDAAYFSDFDGNVLVIACHPKSDQ